MFVCCLFHSDMTEDSDMSDLTTQQRRRRSDSQKQDPSSDQEHISELVLTQAEVESTMKKVSAVWFIACTVKFCL